MFHIFIWQHETSKRLRVQYIFRCNSKAREINRSALFVCQIMSQGLHRERDVPVIGLDPPLLEARHVQRFLGFGSVTLPGSDPVSHTR